MQKMKITRAFEKFLNTKDIHITYCERFLGGMSNYTYHVVVNGIDYVIRIANHEGKIYVDYPSEKLHLFLLEPFEITSKTLYYDTKTGIKIASYLPGHNLTKDLTNADYEGVANELRYLHSLDIEGIDYDMPGRFKRYEKLVKNHLTDTYTQLKALWTNEYHTHYESLPKVFTHGDAQRSNIIKDKEKYFLVDFEFAGMNDPFFDIASFGNIDFFNDSLNLLNAYLKREAQPHELRRVMFYRMFQVLQWHIVALAKYLSGQSEKLHIDFKKYSDNYLSLAQLLADKIKVLPAR